MAEFRQRLNGLKIQSLALHRKCFNSCPRALRHRRGKNEVPVDRECSPVTWQSSQFRGCISDDLLFTLQEGEDTFPESKRILQS